MRFLPMRRSKLVGTEGPGSLVISPEGETAVVGALDFWFKDGYGNPSSFKEEFCITEPRLKAILGVDKFYTPPEFRRQSSNDRHVLPNSNLVIPLLRFPRWHYCSFCKTLKELELDQTSVYLECHECQKKRYFKQVPFVVVCEHGHLTDFPWREWVHKNDKTTCSGNMRIKMSGGTTLDSWLIVCDKCNKSRKLSGVTTTYKDGMIGSYLGDNLNEGSKKYTCTGDRPWCGNEKEQCEAAPVAILRNSINVYMAKKISAIAIPGDYNENVDWLLSKINSPAKYMLRVNLSRFDDMIEKVSFIRDNLRMELKVGTTDEDIEKALLYFHAAENIDIDDELNLEKPETSLRTKEFEKLIERVQSESLKIEPEWTFEDGEENFYRPYLQRISRVLRLKETIVLYGFDRKDVTSMDYQDYYPALYKNYGSLKEKWLPAQEVYGEGIFLQLNLNQIIKWENNPQVQEYFNRYLSRISNVPHRNLDILSPRNIMLHTLSHFLIDEFANTSGYNRSAIRERLYLAEDQAGVLIYTSAGDSEGTLGGLVRLGEKKKIFSILDQAIMRSEWCSSDPVCTELGETQGQGVYGLNGAACYNCSHIPETSCEMGNKYLDRNLMIDETIGFFKS